MVIGKSWYTKLKNERNVYEKKERAWMHKDSIDDKLKKLNALVEQSKKRSRQLSDRINKISNQISAARNKNNAEVESDCIAREESLKQELLSVNDGIAGLLKRIKCAETERRTAKAAAMSLNAKHRSALKATAPLKEEIATQLGVKPQVLYDFSIRIDTEDNIHVRYCSVKNKGDIERHHIIIYLNGETEDIHVFSPLEREIHGWADHNLGLKSPMRY